MTFGAWFLRRGRISRRVWWLHYFLPLWGLLWLAAVADGALGYPGLYSGTAEPASAYAHTGGPLELLISIAMTVPAISGTVARMHDRGLSARWLWWWMVPVVGFLVTFVPSAFLAGHPGPNRYGPPEGAPREPVPA